MSSSKTTEELEKEEAERLERTLNRRSLRGNVFKAVAAAKSTPAVPSEGNASAKGSNGPEEPAGKRRQRELEEEKAEQAKCVFFAGFFLQNGFFFFLLVV